MPSKNQIPCFITLEGGVASGFKKPEEDEFDTRFKMLKQFHEGKCDVAIVDDNAEVFVWVDREETTGINTMSSLPHTNHESVSASRVKPSELGENDGGEIRWGLESGSPGKLGLLHATWRASVIAAHKWGPQKHASWPRVCPERSCLLVVLVACWRHNQWVTEAKELYLSICGPRFP
ncbi:villin-3 [Striga asiatica]|uniref:Villin-3 n=1 Tax=Striga asiatica TaxID=4170 RepID=A0A5A7R4S0_STRAF|nr:villin-3 [Striga asiatica]